MKNMFYILLLILVLFFLGKFLYNKFINKPTVEATVYLNRAISDRKIYYKVNYSGIEFNGSYDLNSKAVQDQKEGKYKIQTVKNGAVFGLELLKNNKAIKSLSFDLLQQTLKIKA